MSYTYNNLTEQLYMLNDIEGGIACFFEAKKYTKIAIYGYGFWIEKMQEMLSGTNVEIQYVINDEDNAKQGKNMYSTKMKLPRVDIIVVTDIDKYLEIEKSICENNHIEVISIQELLDKVIRYTRKG